MELTIGQVLHGFKVNKIEYVDDCDCNLITMEHIQTHARLLYLDREEENKTFAIAFRTIPENDTGVFHILEHSVLNGSRKYPVKEPFVELLKSSEQTFLNAMTYPDKTLFPVSSRNEKDFMNLMDTYLDAVFHPAIYTNPNIFYQEGWHYEINDASEEPIYKGVVYSEMQGAFSSVDEIIVNEANAALFKDNSYKYESGGDPEKIVTLSYEEFINTHKRFYHPSNSYIFLDGSMDLDAVLNKIDSEYLSEYSYLEVNTSIPKQTLVNKEHRLRQYEIEESDDDANRTIIAIGKVVTDYKDVEKIIAYGALNDILVGSNESILKKALLEKDLCEDVEIVMLDGIMQPYMLCVIRNTEANKEEEIKEVIRTEIHKLIETGLDSEMIEASLNQMEFSYREPSEPSGVMYADDALKSWLYDDDPMIYLNRSKCYDSLRKKLNTDYYLDVLKEFFLDEDHLVTMVFEPSKTLAKEREDKIQNQIQNEKKNWKDINEYVSLCKNLHAWQESVNTKEELDTLPKLSLDDVKKESEHIEPDVTELNGVPVLVHPKEKTGIVYLNLYFSIAGLRIDDLASLSFYARLLGDISTEKYDTEELQKRIRRDIGSLYIHSTIIPKKDDLTAAVPVIEVSVSTLPNKVDEARELVLEILQHTKFDPKEIKPFVAQRVDAARQSLLSAGHSIAQSLTLSMQSGPGNALEKMGGFSSMKWTKALNDNYDEGIQEFLERAKMYTEVLFSSSRLTASISGEENLNIVQSYIDALPKTEFQRCIVHYPLNEKKNLGIITPSQVSYVAMSSCVDRDKSIGYMSVLSHILTYEYLWNEVRVKKGAYGTGFNTGSTGIISAYSYRDPSPKTTIETFRNSYSFIDTFVKEHENIDSYIIGSLAHGNPLQSPLQRIHSADRLYFMDSTYEDRQSNRNRILSTNNEKFMELKEDLEKALEDAPYVVVGPKDKIIECGIEEENILKL